MFQSHVPFAFRGAAALAAASALALAAVPADATVVASLAFTTPNGVVGQTDSIDIFLTLTLDASSDALITDQFGRLTSGLNDADYAAAGLDPADVRGAYINVFFQCGGNFDTLCNPDTGEYDVDFKFDGKNINIAAGGSYNFLYATFRPSDGVVAPGDYTFYNAGIFGVPTDENGEAFTDPDTGNDVTITFGQTCPYPYSESCAFKRTVEGGATAPVPEPSTWAMLIAGFGAVGYSLRRRKTGYAMRQAV